MVFAAFLLDFSKKMQWSKPCQNCQNIHGNLVCLIFLSCRVLVKHGKKIRGITHTKQGAKLFMDRIWSLYFRLLLYDITSFVILFPNFYCHITICLTYFTIRKQKYQKYFGDLGLSHGEKREETAIFEKQPFVQNLSRSIWKEEVCWWLLLPQS